MSSDPSWEHHYCLACDIRTDDDLYCSESCRLKDWENGSSPSSAATSPGLAEPPTYRWTNTVPRNSTGFRLEPAYDFSNPAPYGSTPPAQSHLPQRPTFSSTTASTRVLTPSSSHSSLCSLGSTVSGKSDASQVSSMNIKQLRDYSNSFETARPQQRRRSC
ncbi:hypothetical protein F5Y18DRAFT_100823 [Xylariaceae sp. FL1019]|nr:hypothetical protein F5Y18DRAFT_100823 [Xylariaceae sp. FL1019]